MTDDREPGRPLVERIGLAGIALVMSALFIAIAAGSFAGDVPFLGVMAAIGALMTLWVGAVSVFRR